MALTLLDIFNQSSSRSDFIAKSGNDPNAGKMYDQFKKMSNNTGGGNSSSFFSSNTATQPIEPPTDKGIIGQGLDLLGKGVKTAIGLVDSAVKLSGNVVNASLETQMGKPGDKTLMNIASTLGNQGIAGLISLGKQGAGSILDQLTKESVLLSDVNTKIGISGELSDGLRDSMVNAQSAARKYGFELSNIGEFYTQLAEQSGKFSLINRATIESAAPVAAALNMSLSEMAASIGEYERVGLGAKETTEAIGKAATRSVSLGLNARKVADGMKESVGKLNEYGFKNGVQGLERMVQKSIEFKVSMDNIATIADKVLNPEGAIDLAANLQVLGGAIGDFGDPIKMMYDATNNVEGLQDSLIGAAKGLATYNKEQGRFEITGINLRRAKEMAGALGITMGELTKTAIATQERMSASTALMGTGLKMEDKDKEFITNLSRMQGGEMKIVVPESIAEKLGVPTEIALEKLDQKTADALIANQKKFEELTPEKMAQAQLTETQKMVRDVEVMATWAKIQAAHFLKGGAEAGVGDMVKKMRASIEGVVGDMKTNTKGAEAAGASSVEAIKNIKLLDWDSYVNAFNKTKEGLAKTMNPTQQAQAQQPQVQTVKHDITIVSNPAADSIAEAARKNAAFGFVSTNSGEYNNLSIAKKKGK